MVIIQQHFNLWCCCGVFFHDDDSFFIHSYFQQLFHFFWSTTTRKNWIIVSANTHHFHLNIYHQQPIIIIDHDRILAAAKWCLTICWLHAVRTYSCWQGMPVRPDIGWKYIVITPLLLLDKRFFACVNEGRLIIVTHLIHVRGHIHLAENFIYFFSVFSAYDTYMSSRGTHEGSKTAAHGDKGFDCLFH